MTSAGTPIDAQGVSAPSSTLRPSNVEGLWAAEVATLTSQRPRADYERGTLVGSRCDSCRRPVWPARAVCHACGSTNIGIQEFAPTGQLVTWTRVHVPRPGLETPYVLGQVRLDDRGPVVFGHLRGMREDSAAPTSLRLCLGDPQVTPWYWFEPFP